MQGRPPQRAGSDVILGASSRVTTRLYANSPRLPRSTIRSQQRTVSAIIVSAGPIVTDNYPFDNLAGKVAVMLLQGTEDNAYTRETELQVTAELEAHGIEAEYHDVPGGEHLTAYLDYASEIFDFLDRH